MYAYTFLWSDVSWPLKDLCYAALAFASDNLKNNGHFVCKFYQGAEDKLLQTKLQKLFQHVYREKPESSRKVRIKIMTTNRPLRPPRSPQTLPFATPRAILVVIYPPCSATDRDIASALGLKGGVLCRYNEEGTRYSRRCRGKDGIIVVER